jgi:hypothetical protein
MICLIWLIYVVNLICLTLICLIYVVDRVCLIQSTKPINCRPKLPVLESAGFSLRLAEFFDFQSTLVRTSGVSHFQSWSVTPLASTAVVVMASFKIFKTPAASAVD